MTARATGGCLCGAVRFAATDQPMWAVHCHCQSCRRASGAPLVTWVGFADSAFEYEAGAPRQYASSPGVLREFCGRCGTPLTYRADKYPGEVHVAATTLDEPERIAPSRHVHAAEKLDWLHVDDQLPGYPAGSPRANN